jgi:hypothetical protein
MSPPENFEILGALRCILEAPEAVIIATVTVSFHHKPYNYYIKVMQEQLYASGSYHGI